VVEGLTTVQRRRWNVVEKLELVQEFAAEDERLVVARKHGITPSLLFRWRKLMSDGGKVAVQADDQVLPCPTKPEPEILFVSGPWRTGHADQGVDLGTLCPKEVRQALPLRG
jgi:Transposase and inactivated derivatives